MNTYQICVEYLGTNFVGWQLQKNGLSIQEVLEKVISNFLRNKTRITGSGRTDAGVHANGQSVHFKTKNVISNRKKFLDSINFFLKDYPISVLSIKKRPKNFHARHSAKERTYKYLIINRPSSLVIEKDKAWHVKKKLNTQLIKKGVKILIGTHDFSTFRASSCQSKSPIKTIRSATLKKEKDKIILFFHSKSFLQQQVRSMVGSLKYLGEEKWSLKQFKKAFSSKDRTKCAPPAPACGLYLDKVKY